MFNRCAQRGVSLVELLIAIGVIAVGLAGVAASLIFGVTRSNTGDTMAQAAHHARILTETTIGRSLVSTLPLNAQGLPDSDSGLNDTPEQAPRALTAPPFQDPTIHPEIDAESLAKFRRKITLSRRGAAGTPGEFLVNMSVTIYWEERGVDKSVTTTAVIPTSVKIP